MPHAGAARMMIKGVRRMYNRDDVMPASYSDFDRGMIAGLRIATPTLENETLLQITSWDNEARFLAFYYRKDQDD